MKGKEYINKRLEYEGYYSNNKKWNGKGFDEKGNIVYEIINGNGKIREYHENGKIKYEGECLNGEKNRKGKEYYNNGNLKFEGEYLNGLRHGKGKEYYDNGHLRFEGEYSKGEKVSK